MYIIYMYMYESRSPDCMNWKYSGSVMEFEEILDVTAQVVKANSEGCGRKTTCNIYMKIKCTVPKERRCKYMCKHVVTYMYIHVGIDVGG